MSITLNNKNFIAYIIILVIHIYIYIYIYISKTGNINILNNKITSFCYYSYLINKF